MTAAAIAPTASGDTVKLPPSALIEDDDGDFANTPAAAIVSNGLGGLCMALNICPEAVQSGKRVKMIHKKGEIALSTDLQLKWNVDYKAGRVASIRVVTLKGKTGEEVPEGGEPAAEGEIKAVESAAGDAGAAAVSGRKRARREIKPENIDVKKYILLAVEGLRFKGKEAEAEQLQKVAEEL
jgi:hypothetical protein